MHSTLLSISFLIVLGGLSQSAVVQQKQLSFSLFDSDDCLNPCTPRQVNDMHFYSTRLGLNTQPDYTMHVPNDDGDEFVMTDDQGSDRTVLFLDGETSDQVHFILYLPQDESLHRLGLIANDTDILTYYTWSNNVNNVVDPKNRLMNNITVVNFFDRLVGSVSSIITARTNKGRVFSTMVHYYVSGFVGLKTFPNGTKSVITGFEHPPLVFNNPRDVIDLSPHGALRIPIAYQFPGPDAGAAHSGGHHDQDKQGYYHHQGGHGHGAGNGNHAHDHDHDHDHYRDDEYHYYHGGQKHGHGKGYDHDYFHDEHGYGTAEPYAEETKPVDVTPLPSTPGPDENRYYYGYVPLASTIAELMTGTRVFVGGETLGSASDIVKSDNDACKWLTPAHLRSSGDHDYRPRHEWDDEANDSGNDQYIFDKDKCGVGFDVEDGAILVKVEPYKSGYASISLVAPGLQVNGEVAEMSIHIQVKAPSQVEPLVIIDGDLSVIFDYYGREVFSLHMKNTLAPPQMANATDYIVDLPDGRYARADFDQSQFRGDVQKITFVTVQPGEMNQSVLNSLQLPALPYENHQEMTTSNATTTRSSQLNPSSSKAMNRLNVRSDLTKDDGDNKGSVGDGYAKNSYSNKEEPSPYPTQNSEAMPMSSPLSSDASGATMMPEATAEPKQELHFSHVYVKIPPNEMYQIALTSSGGYIITEFAGKRLAKPGKVHKSASRTYLRVSVVLYDYSEKNLSAHKADQIGRAVADMVRNGSGTPTKAELSDLRTRKSSIIATYDVEASHNGSGIATALTVQHSDTASTIEQDSMLRPGSVGLFDARVLPKLTSENLHGSGYEKNTVSGGASSALVAAIIGLSVILALPLLVLLFGCIVYRRHRDRDRSELSQ